MELSSGTGALTKTAPGIHSLRMSAYGLPQIFSLAACLLVAPSSLPALLAVVGMTSVDGLVPCVWSSCLVPSRFLEI